MSYYDDEYQRDVDDDNPGMDSNHEYQEPDEPYDDSNYASYTDNSSKNDGCFIATAAYGSQLDREVISLRIFRDTYLLQRKFGRLFIENYYAISPPIAKVISNYEMLKIITRALLKPIIFIVRIIIKKRL